MKKYYSIWVWALVAAFAVSCEEDRLTENDIFEPGIPDGGPTVQDGVEKVDNPYWEWVKKYPGTISDSVERLVDGVDVTIDADYKTMHPNSRLSQYTGKTRAWFSTGLYAPPAEVITIIKPRGLQTGVKVRIGATTCSLKGDDKLLRFPNIHAVFSLDSDTVRVYNLFGGNIYLIPSEPISSPVTFTVKGAVKSPDFVLGKTDVNAWLEELKTTEVPFAEFASKKVVWSMPTRILKTITDGQEFLKLLAFYDDVVEHDYDEYTGLRQDEPGELHGAMDFPGRHVTDIQVCAGAAHAGYPAMYGETYGEKGVQYSVMTTGSAWGFFHEFGHGYQVPVWMWSESDSKVGGGINEVSNNFHIFHSMTRLNGAWPEDIVSSWQNAIDRYVKVNDSSKDFDAPVGTVLGNVINEDKVKIIPFMQLAQRFGWRLYAYLGRTSRELDQDVVDKINQNPKQRRREFFCLRVAEWAQKDLRAFFDAWGFKYGPFVAEEMAKLPALAANDKFWEVFDASVIPSFEDKDTDGYVKLDNSALWKSGDFDRTDWVVTSTAAVYDRDATVKGAPEYVIDESNTTCIAIVKPGKTYDGVKGTDPMDFVVNMGVKNTFNYVKIANRSGFPQLSVQKISLYGSNTGKANDFTVIKEGIATNKSASGQQKFALGGNFAYQYIRVKYDAWDTASGSTVQLADFRVGIE